MARHCYLVQTHRNPSQIKRLTSALLRGNRAAQVVICHDVGGCQINPADLPGVRVLSTRERVVRPEWSEAQAFLDAVATLDEMGVQYDWLTYISGQDYPIRPVRDYEAHVERAGVDGFMFYGAVFGPDNPWKRRLHGYYRYYYHYRRLAKSWRPWLRRFHFLNNWQRRWHIHHTMGAYLGSRVRQHPFTDQFRCYGGSSWHTLNRRCIDFLRTEMVPGNPVREHFKYTMAPVESYVQTVLANSGQFKLSHDYLRFIDFTNSVGGSPQLLRTADFDRMVASGQFFARKFDMDVDAQIFDLLDEHIAESESRVPASA